MATLSLALAVLGVAGPLWAFRRMRVVEVLQPRFAAPTLDAQALGGHGLGWLLPPLMGAGYLAVRPFLLNWLTVVELFVLEVLLAGLFATAILWWMPPLLRGAIALAELLLRPFLPLETLLVGRRLRLTSRALVLTVAGVTLVFSLLTALHDITRALKREIAEWSEVALTPYVFVWPVARAAPEAWLTEILDERGLYRFRLSRKVKGELPLRLVMAADVNPYLAAAGRPLLGPGKVMVSRTLAARFDLAPGDRMILHIETESHRFVIVEVADDVGFFADDGQYVDLKSWFLASDGNPLFASLETTLGDYAAVRRRGAGVPDAADIRAIWPHYAEARRGEGLATWQIAEIDRDFLIFDLILGATLVLAAVGVANGMLIQVHARSRELSVLRSLGVSRGQTTRLLLVEGAIVGLVSGILAVLLGHAIGAISIAFLDRFTLFDYRLVASPEAGLAIAGLAVVTCCLAAVYPAVVANRLSSAESLHYE